MGWFWQQSAQPKAAAASSSTAPTTTTATTTAPSPSPPLSSPSSSSSPESAADREVQKFFDMLQAEIQHQQTKQIQSSKPSTSSPSSSAHTEQQQQPSNPSSSPWFSWPSSSSPPQKPSSPSPSPVLKTTLPSSTRRAPNPSSLAMSEHTLPTTMSCRDAFDYAWHCNSAGAQWTSVYRYGGVRSCSELWDDFWFCMRTRSWGPEMRAAAVAARARERERARYFEPGRPSSEDVWDSRDERVPRGEAFRAQLPPLLVDGDGDGGVDDAEFQRRELERRVRIRRELGFDKEGQEGQ